MKTIVSMNAQGRLTVPAAARQALQLEGPTEFELEVTPDEIILRPAIIIPRADAWAYTPEHIRELDRALEDGRQGRTQRLTEQELERLAAERS